MATATDIQDIADILGVTFQEHCSATLLKVGQVVFTQSCILDKSSSHNLVFWKNRLYTI